MKNIFKLIATELDYHNEFTTKEFVLYSILATVCAVLIACGESIILSIL